MEVQFEETDSIAFNANVLKIENTDRNVDFKNFENQYLLKYSPKYVYAKILTDDIENIHYLEQNGFEFIETQFQLFKRLNSVFDLSQFKDSLKTEEVTDINELETINSVCDEAFKSIDRVFIDEKLSTDIAQKRYHLYIKNSFQKDNQRLDKIIDIATNKIIGFHTLLYKDEKSILLLLSGILPEYQSTGANYALLHSVYNNLFLSGYKNLTTHVSAKNLKVLNFSTKVSDFKITKTFVVLRKVYQKI